MARWSDRFAKVIGIGQGLQWLWSIGGATVLAFLAGGALTLAALPGWAIAGAMVGVFLLAVALIWAIVDRFRPKPAQSPLTPIIERGITLRDRLLADSEVGTPEHIAEWTIRCRES